MPDTAAFTLRKQAAIEPQVRAADTAVGYFDDRLSGVLQHRIGHVLDDDLARALKGCCFHIDIWLFLGDGQIKKLCTWCVRVRPVTHARVEAVDLRQLIG